MRTGGTNIEIIMLRDLSQIAPHRITQLHHDCFFRQLIAKAGEGLEIVTTLSSEAFVFVGWVSAYTHYPSIEMDVSETTLTVQNFVKDPVLSYTKQSVTCVVVVTNIKLRSHLNALSNLT